MIYEQRVYEALPGKMQALQRRFADHTIRLFEKHGMTVVGFWTNYIGGQSNQLIYMLGYQDLADRERAWAAFSADPEWQEEAGERGGGAAGGEDEQHHAPADGVLADEVGTGLPPGLPIGTLFD